MGGLTSASMVDGIKKAEELLAKKEREEKGDLDGLPPGHPLLRALEEAEQRHVEKEFLENEKKEAEEQRKVRKAKKVKKKVQSREERDKLEDEAKDRRTVAKKINLKITNVLAAVEDLIRTNEELSEVIKSMPHMNVRMARAMRLSAALHRGLSDSKINQTVVGRVG